MHEQGRLDTEPSATDTVGTRAQGFTSLHDEVRVDRLPVTGEVPAWLSGSVIRTTPALLDVAGSPVGHWFDGLGMLNVFSMEHGRVPYLNRFLDTAAYRRARRSQRYLGISMNTDPCRHLGQRVVTVHDPRQLAFNPNVNVVKLGRAFPRHHRGAGTG